MTEATQDPGSLARVAQAAQIERLARLVRDEGIVTLVETGWSYREIADAVGMSPSAIGRIMKRHEASRN